MNEERKKSCAQRKSGQLRNKETYLQEILLTDMKKDGQNLRHISKREQILTGHQMS